MSQIQQIIDYIDAKYKLAGQPLNVRFELVKNALSGLHIQNNTFPTNELVNEIAVHKMYLEEIQKTVNAAAQQQVIVPNNQYVLQNTVGPNSMYQQQQQVIIPNLLQQQQQNNGLNLGGGIPGWNNSSKPIINTMTTHDNDDLDFGRHNRVLPKPNIPNRPVEQNNTIETTQNVKFIPLPGHERIPFVDGSVKVEPVNLQGTNYYQYKYTKLEGQNMNEIRLVKVDAGNNNVNVFTINNDVINKTYLAMMYEDLENKEGVSGIESIVFDNHLIPVYENQSTELIVNIVKNKPDYISIIKSMKDSCETYITLNAINDAIMPVLNLCLNAYVNLTADNIKDIDAIEKAIKTETDGAVLNNYAQLNNCLTSILKSGLVAEQADLKFKSNKMKLVSLFFRQKEIYITEEYVANMLSVNNFDNKKPLLISKLSAPNFFDLITKAMVIDNEPAYFIKMYVEGHSEIYYILRSNDGYLITKK